MTTEIVVSFDDAAASGGPITISRHGSARSRSRVLYVADASMAMIPEVPDEQIQMLGRDEWVALVDRAARRSLNMSGEEFIRRWDAGEFGDPDENPEIMRIGMILPSGR